MATTSPPSPVPPQMQMAQEGLSRSVADVEKRPVDLMKASWAEIEKSVIKLLGGAFKVDRPEHQTVALGVAAVFAARLSEELGAFWFPQRDALEGAALGFPEALITLSPFGAALDALSMSKLQRLEELTAELRKQVAAAKFSIAGGGTPVKLRPDDYARLFDAGFIQLTALDPARLKQVWEGTPAAAAREIREALGRAGQLPPEAKRQMEAQLVGTLSRLDPQKPLQGQPEAAGLMELMGHLFASKAATGIGPEELWREVAFPLAMAGAPAQFPPVEPDDLEAYVQGAPVVALFVDLVPYQSPAADEDGLLGVIPMDHLSLPPGAGASRGMAPRLIRAKPDSMRAALQGFDPAKTKDALQRFAKYLEEKAGKKGAETPGSRRMEEIGFALLEDVRRVMGAVDQGAELYVRRLTEAEAASEPALSVLRDALQGPRIILA
ncbi:MAG TPA: hypothetical protein VND93_22360 [Myxococcales bacterium]|nr:hypothetical protein [Myxococcales bacterium]